ncbi:MAG: hypothetical protein BJ554DRAFT_6177, partial [Olpidium bornovanus]
AGEKDVEAYLVDGEYVRVAYSHWAAPQIGADLQEPLALLPQGLHRDPPFCPGASGDRPWPTMEVPLSRAADARPGLDTRDGSSGPGKGAPAAAQNGASGTKDDAGNMSDSSTVAERLVSYEPEADEYWGRSLQQVPVQTYGPSAPPRPPSLTLDVGEWRLLSDAASCENGRDLRRLPPSGLATVAAPLGTIPPEGRPYPLLMVVPREPPLYEEVDEPEKASARSNSDEKLASQLGLHDARSKDRRRPAVPLPAAG